jgi:predicted metal-dependent phosphotriesterase family hydrolase
VGGHVPIGLHSCAGAREQMRCLADAGANVAKTFCAHIEAKFGWEGRTPEQEASYLEEVLKAGGSLVFNNFDFEFDTPWRDMVYLINELDRRGYSGQILLTIDVNWEFDTDGNIWHEQQKNHPETGRRDYAYMITHAVPMLMAEGVSLQRINRYLIDNPRRILEP